MSKHALARQRRKGPQAKPRRKGPLGRYATLADAVGGYACLEDLVEMMAGMSQEEVEEKNHRGRTALHFAASEDTAIFKLILDAMSKEAIVLTDLMGCDALHYALTKGMKEAVLLFAERMEKEEDWNPFLIPCGRHTKVFALFLGSLISDREMVDLVAGLVPDELFRDFGRFDPLACALKARRESSHAVEVCMRKREGGETPRTDLLRYLELAAEYKDLAMLKKMHEAIPMLADGSGRRECAENYSGALSAAACNRQHALANLEYLVEEGGSDVLDKCDPLIVLKVHTLNHLDWLLARCPSLLTRACSNERLLSHLIHSSPTARESLIDRMLRLVEPEGVAALLQHPIGLSPSDAGWRHLLRRLFDGRPEVWQGRLGEVMLDAVSNKEYEDVACLLDLCSPADLVVRNEAGDNASDVAARDDLFPRELLPRLVVVRTKNAY